MYGPYVDAMNKEMHSYVAIASTFVQELELFDRRISSFNTELQKALKETATFARFRDLSVNEARGHAPSVLKRPANAVADIHVADAQRTVHVDEIADDGRRPPCIRQRDIGGGHGCAVQPC
ncbi:ATP-binding protein [Variovorax sp. 160MFSha2.1]|uniref:ATP-binding protein n=1 Tax=Variovorax sp. 160MFSha2.1 TaxID=3158367 RepID=UPI003AB0FEE8